MKLAVSMICLNEEAYIGSAVYFCSFADDVCIVDGGSTDDTIKTVEEALEDQPTSLYYRVIPWQNDFGLQRQNSLDLVTPDVDWWMRLDADEIYSGDFISGVRPMLKQLPEDVIAVRIRQTNLYPDEDHYAASHGGWETHPRIFRNLRLPDGKPALRWVGQVHEHVMWMTTKGLVDIPEEKVVTWGAQVYHCGWLSQARREEREDLYAAIPGSGVAERGDLTGRDYVVRDLPW